MDWAVSCASHPPNFPPCSLWAIAFSFFFPSAFSLDAAQRNLGGEENLSRIPLRSIRATELDAEAIVEELEDMGRSERRAVESHLKNLLSHLLKWARQAKRRSGSWRDNIDADRDALDDLLDDSPSLRPRLPEFIERQHPHACRSAANQTGLAETVFPSTCPFTLDQIFDHEFFPKTEKG